jgi:FlaA1/EpsC-like NDP-sugar epimerase
VTRGLFISHPWLRRSVVMAGHAVIFGIAYFFAFALRFDFSNDHLYAGRMLRWFPILVVLRLAAFHFAGLFRGLWKYTSTRDLQRIVLATTASTIAFEAALGILFRVLPRSVIVIEWGLCIMLVGGVRFAYRQLTAARLPVLRKDQRRQKLLIVGAGDAGEMLLREIGRHSEHRYQVVGFLDDSREKLHADIHGVRVLGGLDALPVMVVSHDVDEVILAVPSATGPQMRRIVDLCKAANVRFKTMPGVDQLIDGRVSLNQVRNVAIEDLLGRDPVKLDMNAIGDAIEGHVVMVTGAGGSIGSELCRQVARFSPSALLLVERTENSLFEIHRELLGKGLSPSALVPCVADVADVARMEALFALHSPTVVIHAAAHKHVPMMEWNPGEAVKNNVGGTRTLAELAHRHLVERFVMVSTDKAVNPTSVMGATKRVAEICVQSLSQQSRTRFVTVRFGNVLGSAGSVIPIFKEQIAAGGPVTVTHPEMKRYFMTIPEACQLVLQAGTMGEGGEIFILDMGEPVKIADLARDLITLSGFTPGDDIEITFTGMRPGEKLFEELSVDAEAAVKTSHPKIFVGKFRPYEWDRVQKGTDRLLAVAGQPPAEVRHALRDLVPEYRPPGEG